MVDNKWQVGKKGMKASAASLRSVGENSTLVMTQGISGVSTVRVCPGRKPGQEDQDHFESN